MKCEKCLEEWSIQTLSDRMVKFCPFCGSEYKEKEPESFFSLVDCFKYLKRRFTYTIFFEPNKILSYVSDYMPKLMVEKRILKVALEAGAYKQLLDDSGKVIEVNIQKTKFMLTNDYGLSERWAGEVVDWLVEAFGADQSKDVVEAEVTTVTNATPLKENQAIISRNERGDYTYVGQTDAKGVPNGPGEMTYSSALNATKGMYKPVFKEVHLGTISIRKIFKVSNVGVIAGAYVQEGKVQRNALIRVVRDGVVIHEGRVASLRRFKDDVKEVASGYECGIGIENFNDIHEDDTIEAYLMQQEVISYKEATALTNSNKIIGCDKRGDYTYVGQTDAKGVPNGSGEMTYSSGEKFIGTFKNGCLCGKGKWLTPYGQTFEGMFKNGKQVRGDGVLIERDGTMYKGYFRGGLKKHGGMVVTKKWPKEVSTEYYYNGKKF